MDGRKRRKAFDNPYHAHALTFSVYRRQPLLLLPGVGHMFLAHLDAARNLLGFDIWAYVVMPEHVHVVLCPRREVYSVAAILKAVKAPAAKEIFALHPHLRETCRAEREGRVDEFRFWQPGGGFDKNLISAKAAWTEIRYVHQNPVKRGLCEVSTDWPLSSAGAYAEEPGPTTIPVDLCHWETG